MTNTNETTITITAEQIATARELIAKYDKFADDAAARGDYNTEVTFISMIQGIEKAAGIFGIEF